jgi:hypothetical protein
MTVQRPAAEEVGRDLWMESWSVIAERDFAIQDDFVQPELLLRFPR